MFALQEAHRHYPVPVPGLPNDQPVEHPANKKLQTVLEQTRLKRSLIPGSGVMLQLPNARCPHLVFPSPPWGSKTAGWNLPSHFGGDCWKGQNPVRDIVIKTRKLEGLRACPEYN